jgi:hypothetical protein
VHLLSRIPRERIVEVTIQATKEYIRALLENPNNGKDLTEHYVSRITCQISWGDDTVAKRNKDTARELLRHVSPGATPLSKFPFLGFFWDLLPDICQPWKVKELARSKLERQFWLEQQDKARASTDSSYTLMQEFFKRQDRGVSDEGEAAGVIGMLTIIGSLLLSTPIQIFLMAMCIYPEWQIKGAEELDRVCPDRLPVPSDLEKLPVLRAIIREVHRWRPAVPFGKLHTTVYLY